MATLHRTLARVRTAGSASRDPAVALFIETADPGEMKERRREHVFANHPELAIGTLLATIRQSRVPRAAFETSQ